MEAELAGFVWFSFAAGAATFFAPCSYPLLPGYVAYYVGDAGPPIGAVRRRIRRAALVGVTVSAGFTLVYGVFGGAMVVVGSRALANVVVLELVVGSVVVVLGAYMAAGRPIPALAPPSVRLPARRRSVAGYFLFGVVYAAAAAGCTVPLFVGISGFALRTGPVDAILLVGSYVGGMSALMIGLTVLAAVGRDAVVRRLSRTVGHIRRASGLLLVIAGAAQLYLFFFRYDGLQSLGLA